jgi:hypothetical protein
MMIYYNIKFRQANSWMEDLDNWNVISFLRSNSNLSLPNIYATFRFLDSINVIVDEKQL